MEGDPEAPRVLRRATLCEGARFDFDELTLASPRGGEFKRQFVRHPGAVCILPLLGEGPDLRVVMIRSHRPAVGGYVWEIPAGTLEPGEPPETCAGRELVEETGFEAATLRSLGRFHTSPGLTDELMWAFLATGLREVGQRLEADEHIAVRPVSVARAAALLDGGEISDGKTMLTLLLAARSGALTL